MATSSSTSMVASIRRGGYPEFFGYGAGASFTRNDATHWQVNFNGGASHEVITFLNLPSIQPFDVLFV